MTIPRSGECHVWLVPVHPRPGWSALLDERERQKADRIAGAPAGTVFVTSRAAQRLVGAHYLGVAPAEVTIDRDCPHCDAPDVRHGRPVFRAAEFDYSVSHTERWLVIAVTGDGLVGVDIEHLAAVPDIDGLARAALGAGERDRFESLSPRERTAWLLSAWTRKEAAMKLAGLGLRAPPCQIDVTTPIARATAIPHWPTDEIFLHDIDAPDGHVLALATTVPLTSVRRFALSTPSAASVHLAAHGRRTEGVPRAMSGAC